MLIMQYGNADNINKVSRRTQGVLKGKEKEDVCVLIIIKSFPTKAIKHVIYLKFTIFVADIKA